MNPDTRYHHDYSYVARGMYARHLERWYNFYPPEQILLVKSEDLYMDPKATMIRIAKFLRLSGDELPAVSYLQLNTGGYGGKMDSKNRDMLRGLYRPHNQELCKFVDFDISD
jgi:Sulfotransferase domain